MRYFVLAAVTSVLLSDCSRPETEQLMLPATGNPNTIPAEADAVLESWPTFELLSLDPSVPEADGEDRFHQWKVLGSTQINDAQTRTKVIAALRKGVPKYDDGSRAACFWPRHGIRVKDGEMQFDFVICFECAYAVVYAGNNEKDIGGFQIAGSPQPAFDKALKSKGVKLPKQSGG